MFGKVVSFHSLKERSFVGWTSIELSIPITSVVLPRRIGLCAVARRKPTAALTGFPGRNRLRLHAAAPGGGQRPRRGCRAVALKRCRRGRQDERWPGASIREAGRDIESPWLGVIQQNVGNSDHKWHVNEWSECNMPYRHQLWQSCVFPLLKAKHVGNNDHNVICQYVWKTDDLTCRWNTNRPMAHFQECCKVWGFQGEQGEDPVSNLGTFIINLWYMSMCSFFLLKGFDFQELFGQIVAVTPSLHQLILSQQICSSLVEQMLTKDRK